MSITALATRMSVTRASLYKAWSRYRESGQDVPLKADAAKNAAKALGLRLAWLLDETGPPWDIRGDNDWPFAEISPKQWQEMSSQEREQFILRVAAILMRH